MSSHFGSRSSSLGYYVVTGSGAVTTTSSTYSVVTGMTKTPEAGTWLVIFSGTFRIGSNGADGDFAIYSNSAIVQYSNRRQFISASVAGLISNNLGSFGTPHAIVTVNGSQAIEGRFRATSGTIAIDDRNMILIRVA